MGSCADMPWKNASADPDARADSIMACMTLEEKISLLGADDVTGSILLPLADQHTGVSHGIPRLGIPTTNYTDGPVGVRQGSATAMPASMAIAASFDPTLANDYGAVVGREAKFKGNDVVFAPCVDMTRNPLAGRIFETFGEDPYLTRKLSNEWIKGMQDQGVIASVKHYVGNNQELNRNVIDEIIDDRTLRELYLPAYEDAVKVANVGSVMCAYNSVNGAFMCENDILQNQILKNEWGFKGYILTDYPADHSTAGGIANGLELELPITFFNENTKVNAALAAGQITLAQIDDHVHRILRTAFAFGQFDRPLYVNNDAQIDRVGHNAVAQKITERGMVLLKNAGNLLPLSDTTITKIALIGRDATAYKTSGSPSSGTVTPFAFITPEQGLKTRAPNITYVLNDGSNPVTAATAAMTADVAIVLVSTDEREFADRPCMTLLCSQPNYGDQDALINAVVAANPKTIVVVASGGPVLMPWRTTVPSIVQSWYIGQAGGTALARLLFGDVNFTGKLPLTMWAAEGDQPTFNNPSRYPGTPGSTVVGATFTGTYSEGIYTGYRWADAMNKAVQYPFGFGLSYTSFSYSNLRLNYTAGGNTTVTVNLQNTGSRSGTEVAQLYLSLPSPSATVTQPPLWLKGFSAETLNAGASRDVTFILNQRDLSYWDVVSKSWQVASGCYKVQVGGHSRDTALAAAGFSVGGAMCP